MAWSFGDGFDLYAASADALNGYWDSGTTTGFTLVAGRFSGSQAAQNSGNTAWLTKASSSNDAVHHIVCAFRQTAAISGTTLGMYLQLVDGTTNQCCIVFRSDGAILLTSGGPAGTVLATYTGAFPVASTWYAFEMEVVVNNTTGSFSVRKNGNPSNDFTLGSLNTRGGTANNYANKLTQGQNATVTSQQIDDLLWRSDAASVSWAGDLRCITRMPASDASVQFSRTPTGALTQTSVGGSTLSSASTNPAVYTAFVAGYSGTITSTSVAINSLAGALNMKCAIHADNGSGAPGAVLASATASVTPIVGANVFTFSPGVPIVKGVQYWIGAITDSSSGNGTVYTASTAATSLSYMPMAYAAFPQANPLLTTSRTAQMSWTYTATPANWQAVSEPQQDATTSYVYSSTPGQADFYGIGSIASTPSQVFATTVRALMQKSDAGTRTAAAQLKSGATTVASPTVVLTTSGWLWAWRTDVTDPNTGSAWTPAAVNGVTIGVAVVA